MKPPPNRSVLLVVSLATTLTTVGSAQTAPQAPPPATEVYLAALGRDGLSAGAVNISNNPGYDNQPSFTPDGKAILFSSNRDGKQTDIYRYDIGTKALTQLTHTPESEYSPLVTPDGMTFSVVRVEADNTQRLWRFDLDGSHPRLILESVKPVGYHVWIDGTHIGLFLLGASNQPATLQIADTTTGKLEVITSGIGRSLAMRPGTGIVTFVSKPPGGHWMISEVDPTTHAITPIVETLEGSEDYAWDPVDPGRLHMARGSKLFTWKPGATAWQEEGDLSSQGISTITRLAVNPDRTLGSANRLAFVAEPKAK